MAGKLSIELVPSTAWYTNVRSNVSRKDWTICKDFVKNRSGRRCEICGGVGSRYPVDCHEIFAYDDENQIQTLVDLIALCPPCHEVKHMGRAFVLGNAGRAIGHLMRVNGWSASDTEHYIEVIFEIHAMRSTHNWKLDISYLETLGIDSTVKDRP